MHGFETVTKLNEMDMKDFGGDNDVIVEQQDKLSCSDIIMQADVNNDSESIVAAAVTTCKVNNPQDCPLSKKAKMAECNDNLNSNQGQNNDEHNRQQRQQKNNHGDNSTQNTRNNRNRNNKKSKGKNPEKDARFADIQLSKSLSWVLRHAAPSLGLHLSPDGYVPIDHVLGLNHPRFRNKNIDEWKYALEDVKRVVESSDKQRFRLEYKDVSDLPTTKRSKLRNAKSNDQSSEPKTKCNDDATKDGDLNCNKILCIRANQGHSISKHIQADQLLAPLTNEELSNLTIIHGTTRKAWQDHIRVEGLRRMKRNHIHFATGLPSSAASKNDDHGNKEKNVSPISGMRVTSEIYIYILGNQCAKDGIPFYKSDNGVILSCGVGKEGILSLKYFEKVVNASSGKVVWEGGGD